jgi:FkbM family methyltransferase
MLAAFGALRRVRLRALLARSLTNASDVWDAYRTGAPVPTLRFRHGGTLQHGRGDSPVFLFFEIFANGCYRRHLRLPPSGRIVDIGANIGAFTLDCAFRYPDVRIDAYEPNAAAFHTLEANVAANGLRDRVRLYNEAVGAAPGTLRLWSSDGNIAATAYPSAQEKQSPAADVPMTDLAAVIERAGPVGLLKVDVEGAEADILEGGRAVLGDVDQIVAEYHEARVAGVLRRVEIVLVEQGFVPIVCRDRRCGPLVYASRP